MVLRRGITKACEAAVEQIEKMSKPVESKMAITQVATISAGNEDFIGKIIADAMEKVGKDGVITVEESKSLNTELEVVDACSLTRAMSRLTSSPIPSVWKQYLTSPT
jgi:chaperonin GroEL